MITYEQYTELLSKIINRTITDQEREKVANYEAAQPKTCPKCHAQVRSSFMPNQIVHDVEKCAKKAAA